MSRLQGKQEQDVRRSFRNEQYLSLLDMSMILGNQVFLPMEPRSAPYGPPFEGPWCNHDRNLRGLL